MRAALAAAYIAAIIAANYATSTLGMIPVGFGLTATAGTYLAGLTFVLRDSIQDLAGRRVVIRLILMGAGPSFVLAAPSVAIASAVAFLASELADLAVYTPLRAHGYIRAAIASNIVGATVDTALFLVIAGFPIWPSVPGQMVAKLAITAATVAAVGITRALLRKPQHA